MLIKRGVRWRMIYGHARHPLHMGPEKHEPRVHIGGGRRTLANRDRGSHKCMRIPGGFVESEADQFENARAIDDDLRSRNRSQVHPAACAVRNARANVCVITMASL
jgi:hypothetical protein